jgi:Predicted amidohydrolase
MSSLKLAFIHSAPQHKQPEQNRKELLSLFHQAGKSRAQIVMAPELCISGYSFDSYRDILPYTETASGPTLQALAALCRRYGFYACIGLAEQDSQSGVLYNSAFVLDPKGEQICRYRKINAECRWACPGDPKQSNTFETPWGRIGVLICSDSYHSLMARTTALRGASLLLIPANWPSTNGLDPLEIWQARALENGMYVAVCNRTGQDLSMDCRQTISSVCDPQGEVRFCRSSPTSRLFLTELPLQTSGHLGSEQRFARLAGRDFVDIHACYCNLNSIRDITSFLRLPKPGLLQMYVHTCAKHHALAALEATKRGEEESCKHTLHVLPAADYSESMVTGLRQFCAKNGHVLILYRENEQIGDVLFCDGAEQNIFSWDRRCAHAEQSFPQLECGPARVRLLPRSALFHPEMTIAAAKQGADLVLLFSDTCNPKERLLAGARTIDNVAVVVSSPQEAGIWLPPEGHQRWQETLAQGGKSAGCLVDTVGTRRKYFQDRIDFHILLQHITLHIS